MLGTFATSTYFYSLATQPFILRDQRWYGLLVITCMFGALYLIYVCLRIALSRIMKRYECPEPEAREVMLAACCCGPRKPKPRRSFYPSDSDASDGDDQRDREALLHSDAHQAALATLRRYTAQSTTIQIGGPLELPKAKKDKLRNDEPAYPYRIVLYVVSALNWLSVLLLLPLCVYVPYSAVSYGG